MEEPWRYRCPNGHASWRSCSDGLECKICGLRFDEDELVEVREEEHVEAEFADRR